MRKTGATTHRPLPQRSRRSVDPSTPAPAVGGRPSVSGGRGGGGAARPRLCTSCPPLPLWAGLDSWEHTPKNVSLRWGGWGGRRSAEGRAGPPPRQGAFVPPRPRPVAARRRPTVAPPPPCRRAKRGCTRIWAAGRPPPSLPTQCRAWGLLDKGIPTFCIRASQDVTDLVQQL